MRCQARPAVPPQGVPRQAAPPWRAQLDEIAAVLAEARADRAKPGLEAEVAALIVREAGAALPPATVERLAARVARVLAA